MQARAGAMLALRTEGRVGHRDEGAEGKEGEEDVLGEGHCRGFSGLEVGEGGSANVAR